MTANRFGLLIFACLAGLLLVSCIGNRENAQESSTDLVLATQKSACQVTEPEWLTPPEDSAVQGSPGPGYYYVNADRSIWASAWWHDQDENYLNAGEDGVKVGWFRPAGLDLEIMGSRIDGSAAALEADIPCCYPTRFQATGVYFPTEGCWEVSASAGQSELIFTVWVDP